MCLCNAMYSVTLVYAGYLEHGQSAGDTVVPSPDNVSSRNSAVIELPVPIVFYRRERSVLNVSLLIAS